MKRVAVSVMLALWGACAMAQMSPTGLWKTIDDDGKTMEVRGYIAFIYRTQVWQRVE